MPLYEFKCKEGHTEEHFFHKVAEKLSRKCRECGSWSRQALSSPAITRLEPIPMDRSGHARRAAARRERLTGKPSNLDYTSPSNNNKY